MNEKQITITIDELVPFIKKEGKALAERIKEARVKYGERYNSKNNIELMYRDMGHPEWSPERFAKEFYLIQNRKSNLRASVRYVVRDLCSVALEKAFQAKIEKLEKESKQKHPSPMTP